ncbi:MAG: nucleoside-diphosphate sugar epimerase/dehydratase [Gemmatimonadota bacterium]
MSSPLERSLNGLYKFRRIVALTAYGFISAVSYVLAYFLRFELSFPPEAVDYLSGSIAALVLTRLVVDNLFALSTSRWRFAGTHDVLRLGMAAVFGSAVFYLMANVFQWVGPVPHSVILIECVLTILFTAGLWIAYRTAFEQLRHLRAHNGSARRVLLIGAGEAGSLLAREMVRQPTGFRPVGFVDDDRSKWGTMLHGVTVLGGTDSVAAIAKATRADEIIIAMPSAEPADLWRVVDQCEATKLRFKVLPGISDVLRGDVRLTQLRDLSIEDLLGREPINLQLPELTHDLNERSVLITGAAGSIGSELARQVALHNPALLLLFDQSETGLFYLDNELREKHPELHVIAIIGDITDPIAVERAFRTYRPARVYHAAAYKHVGMMQVNIREALRNNALGTWRLGDAAGRYGVDKFVLVSTDKAVRPTSIMGATKRLAEVIILDLQRRYSRTAFAAVRFGNVLGSSGSVIPIFKEQIEAGKPLTVTHPDATRYFMTIPEAVQLILHSSLLPEVNGRIAMLEMGDPVRIVDLARNLLRLSGAHRNGNQIMFTGLRGGEKLHEELVAPDETTTPTSVSKVRLIAPSDFVIGTLGEVLLEWESLFAANLDQDVVAALLGLFPDLHIQSWDPGAEHTRTPLDFVAESNLSSAAAQSRM